MGIFDSFKSKPAEPSPLQRMQAALLTIGKPIDRPETVSTIAKGAATLILTIEEIHGGKRDDNTIYVGGLLTMVAANHFSRLAGVSFEPTSTLAVMMFSQIPPSDAGDYVARVVGGYNDLAKRHPDAAVEIGKYIAAWAHNPTDAHLNKIEEVYARLVKIGEKIRSQDEPGANPHAGHAAAMRASLASIGYAPSDYNDVEAVGMAATHLVKEILSLIKPNMSVRYTEDWLAIFTSAVGDIFAAIQGVDLPRTRLYAIVGITLPKLRDPSTFGGVMANRMDLVTRFLATNETKVKGLISEIHEATMFWLTEPTPDHFVELASLLSVILKSDTDPAVH